jgi:SNF2 family DNA or RNA helicase
LFMSCYAGKTIQALGVASLYAADWPALIVCPSGARYHWRAEILQWLSPEYVAPARGGGESRDIILVDSGKTDTLPTRTGTGTGAGAGAGIGVKPPFKFMIISFALIAKLQTQLADLRFQMIIVDESHYLKNPLARRTICLSKLITQAPRAILLSGTPALSRPIELFSQLHALQPDIWSDRKEFGERYCRVKGEGRGSRARFSGAKNEGELHALLLGTIMIRRLKADIMTELPAKERVVQLLNIQNEEDVARMAGMFNIIRLHNRKKHNRLPETSLEYDYGGRGSKAVHDMTSSSSGQQNGNGVSSSSSSSGNNNTTSNNNNNNNSSSSSTGGGAGADGLADGLEVWGGGGGEVEDKKQLLLELYMLTGRAKVC